MNYRQINNNNKKPVKIVKNVKVKKKMLIELEDRDIEKIADRILQELKSLLNKTRKDDDVIFDVDGLSRYLKVSKTWIYERTHLNEIPHYKLGRFPRFRRSEIDKWLNSKRKAGIYLEIFQKKLTGYEKQVKKS